MQRNLSIISRALLALLILIDLAFVVLCNAAPDYLFVVTLVVVEAAASILYALFSRGNGLESVGITRRHRFPVLLAALVLAIAFLFGLLFAAYCFYVQMLLTISLTPKLQSVAVLLDALPLSPEALGVLLLSIYGLLCLPGTYRSAVRFVRYMAAPAAVFLGSVVVGCVSGLKTVFVRWKSLLKQIAGYGFWLVVSAVVGCLLMIAAYSIPVEKMYPNAVESANIMVSETAYFHAIPGTEATEVNNFTVARWLNAASYYDDEMTLFENAMSLPRAGYSDDGNAFNDFMQYASGDDGFTTVTYTRYWQGCQVFLRPMLTFLNIWGIRILNVLLQAGFLAAVSVLMKKRGLKRYIVPYLLSALAIAACIALPLSIDLCAVFYIASAAVLLILRPASHAPGHRRARLIFLFSGIATAFFDTLTNPLLTLGLPLMFLLLRDHASAVPDADRKDYFFRRVALVCVVWLIGYAGMWLLKWVAGSIATHTDLFTGGWEQVLLRTSTTSSESDYTRWYVVWVNIRTMFLRNLLAFPALIWITLQFVRTRPSQPRPRLQPGYKNYVVSVVFLALVPLLWYFFASNHSYNHAWFTYRELMISLMGMLFLLADRQNRPGHAIPAINRKSEECLK